jgi:hypothetical protein
MLNSRHDQGCNGKRKAHRFGHTDYLLLSCKCQLEATGLLEYEESERPKEFEVVDEVTELWF